MPTYQYECTACGHGLEAWQSMTDEKLKKCPKCGKNKLIRLIGTGGGVIFKGKGFYETDYKKKDAPKCEAPSPKSPEKTCPAKAEGCCPGCK
ncbi:MAG: zinc ribbon domain-containing protein [Candidatus Omnitrophica bacterium]|nr:zinc ribbon domain-containing protein [Candidatus Omnitrophota bacterium]